MTGPLLRKRLTICAGLAGVYFVAAKLGLRVAFLHPSATPVWPPSGIALAAVLVSGYWAWPGVFVGAFFANVTTAGTIATSLGIAAGNTLEAVLGAYLVRRFARGRAGFAHSKELLLIALLAAGLSTAVSATIGVTSLAVGGFAPWTAYGPIWLTWWLGDAVGDLVVAPVLVLWSTPGPAKRDYAELAGATFGLLAVAWLAFSKSSPIGAHHYPLEYLCIPFLLWAGLRLGPRDAATGVLLLAALAIWGTLEGAGPFARPSPNESLLLLQAFLGSSAVLTLAFAALVAERTDAVDQLRQLAVRDPLTGLANYRELIRVLDAEIGRSERTARAFGLILLDLDGLKKINDRHGHIVGSGALLRVAEVLRASCRAVDTAARFGGDEFALVLPETNAEAAAQVAARLQAGVANDAEPPQLSVSVGVAVYPEDGARAEDLLRAADRLLYDAKARVGARSTRAG